MARRCVPVVLVLFALASSGCWIEDGFSSTRSNWNSSESTLTPSSIGRLHEQAFAFVDGATSVGRPFLDGSRVYIHYQVGSFGDPSNPPHSFVRAFDPNTAALLWTSPALNADFVFTLTVAGSRLLVPTSGNGLGPLIVYELDAATGTIISSDPLGAAQAVQSIAYDGTTAALVAIPNDGSPPQLWFGDPADHPQGGSFTREALVGAPDVSAPAIDGGRLFVRGNDQVFAFDQRPADGTCVPSFPCFPTIVSPHLAPTPGAGGFFSGFPVIDAAEHVVLSSTGGAGSHNLYLLDESSLRSVTVASTPTGTSSAPPAIAAGQIFSQVSDSRTYVHAGGSCPSPTAPATTCAPTKVLNPRTTPARSFVQPIVAGDLVYTFEGSLITAFDRNCTPVGTDAASGLPECVPLLTIGLQASGAAITNGKMYVIFNNGLAVFGLAA